jgi:hypothetical protein
MPSSALNNIGTIYLSQVMLTHPTDLQSKNTHIVSKDPQLLYISRKKHPKYDLKNITCKKMHIWGA